MSAVLSLAAAGTACAQTYDLNARYPTGAVLEVRETQEVRVKVLSGMLEPPDGDIRRLDRATICYRVLQDEAGFPTSQEAIIVSCRSTVENPGSEPVREREARWRGPGSSYRPCPTGRERTAEPTGLSSRPPASTAATTCR